MGGNFRECRHKRPPFIEALRIYRGPSVRRTKKTAASDRTEYDGARRFCMRALPLRAYNPTCLARRSRSSDHATCDNDSNRFWAHDGRAGEQQPHNSRFGAARKILLLYANHSFGTKPSDGSKLIATNNRALPRTSRELQGLSGDWDPPAYRPVAWCRRLLKASAQPRGRPYRHGRLCLWTLRYRWGQTRFQFSWAWDSALLL